MTSKYPMEKKKIHADHLGRNIPLEKKPQVSATVNMLLYNYYYLFFSIYRK